MQYRITDSQLPLDAITLELSDPADWFDDNEPEVTDDQVHQIIEWWASYSNRGGEVHEDSGHVVLVQIDNMQTGVQIGWWCTAEEDRWQLSDFPFTTLHYEEVEA